MAARLDDTVREQHRAAVEKAVDGIGKSRDPKFRLKHEQVVHLMFLNTLIREKGYDISPFHVDLDDLSWADPDDAEKIREVAILGFGSFFRKVAVRSRTKAFFGAILSEQKKIGLHASTDIESEHFAWMRRRREEEKDALRATLKSVAVEPRKADFQKALRADTLGSMLKGAMDADFLPWLQTQTPDYWHVAAEFGWNGEVSDYAWLVEHPMCDRATAWTLYLMLLGVTEDVGWNRYWSGKTMEDLDPVLKTIVERWHTGDFAEGRFAYDFDLKQYYYRLGVEALTADDPATSWLIDPVELEPQEGVEPDCPFYFGDWHAVFRSKAHELAFPPENLPTTA